jgi:hypothetical protein
MQVANPIADLAIRFCIALRTRFSAQLGFGGAAFGRASSLHYFVTVIYLQHCFASAVETIANYRPAPHIVLIGIDCDVDELDPTIVSVTFTHGVQSTLPL